MQVAMMCKDDIMQFTLCLFLFLLVVSLVVPIRLAFGVP